MRVINKVEINSVSAGIKSEIVVGVDASRCRSGGARVHLIGLIENARPEEYGISTIHVWSYDSLLDELTDKPWLVKHRSSLLQKNLLFQLLWQLLILPIQLFRKRVNILFTADASSLCFFSPAVTLSQDLLAYELGMMNIFPWGFDRLRLVAILILQNLAFRRSKAVIFLSQYAAELTQKSCGTLEKISVIPHGISNEFRRDQKITGNKLDAKNRIVKCIYVSHIELYKNQWHVVKAIKKLRDLGYQIELQLVGGVGITDRAFNLLQDEINKIDHADDFIHQLGGVPNSSLPKLIKEADIFIFASSCENLPNTLIEGMAMGMPIACSNAGPMPEVLKDAGIYFNPTDPDSIAEAILEFLKDPELALKKSIEASELSKKYSWSRCSNETLSYISQTYFELLQK